MSLNTLESWSDVTLKAEALLGLTDFMQGNQVPPLWPYEHLAVRSYLDDCDLLTARLSDFSLDNVEICRDHIVAARDLAEETSKRALDILRHYGGFDDDSSDPDLPRPMPAGGLERKIASRRPNLEVVA